MNAKPEYEEAGEFWLASIQNYKQRGTLTVIEGHGIQLETDGLIRPLALETRGDAWDLGRIHGELRDGKQVTLDGCRYKDKIMGKPEKSLVKANRVFIGVQHEEEEIKINTFRFSIEGLSQWLSIRGINYSWNDSMSVTSPTQKKIPYKLENGFTVNIIIRYDLFFRSIPVTKGGIIQKEYIEISSTTPRPYSDFFKLFLRITSFLNIIIDTVVHVKNITATSKEIIEITYADGEEKKEPVVMDVYDSHIPSFERNEEIKGGRILFNFPEVEEHFGQFIKTWIDFYEENEIIFHLYRISKQERLFIELQFLLRFQALEVYARSQLKSGKLAKCKIRDIVNKFSDNVEPPGILKEPLKNFKDEDIKEKFVQRVVKIRNFYTHHNERPNEILFKDEQEKAEETVALYDALEMLIQVCLLQSIGFKNDKISNKLQRPATKIAKRYHYAMEYLNKNL